MDTRALSPASVAQQQGNSLRARPTHSECHGPRVHYAEPDAPRRVTAEFRQRLRIQQFQRRWENIKSDLPPQLSRRHIGMISIGGVIGTGLFLGSGDALNHGGPVGAFLGYFIIGTVVYCLCVSIGEMIAFLPNVGGVVGLADLYVDRALGFSLGWAAWYNWSVTLPTEITAAAILIKFWQPNVSVSLVSGCFLLGATALNCFSSGVYGEFEFWLSSIKVVTIVLIIIISLVLDLGAGNKGFIGFKHWSTPFADEYLGVKGALGRFLGFWAVLMQASFSFFGSEVPGIAAGEVIDATRNVPRALQRVWIRITLFYLGGVFVAGLLIDRSETATSDDSSVNSSPFVIAFRQAGMHWIAHVVNAAVLISAWSAAASDIYIGSRFLFFLARRKHAPKFFASLTRYPPEAPADRRGGDNADSETEDLSDEDEDDLPHVINMNFANSSSLAQHMESLYVDRVKYDHSASDLSEAASGDGVQVSVLPANDADDEEDIPRVPTPPPSRRNTDEQRDVEATMPRRRGSLFVLPLRAVFGTASVGLLCFLGATSGATPEAAFNWLVAVASIASLQSWAGMLYTYIRWYKGTVYVENQNKLKEKTDKEAENVMKDIRRIKEHRHWGQPYLAQYAFSLCILILLTNGWSVFLHNGWRISEIPGESLTQWPDSAKQSAPVSQFLSSYIPLPFFVLLTFGYKLIHRTEMVKVEEMTFPAKNVPPPDPEPKSDSIIDRIWGWFLVI